jgi:circadian clock protein KaiC
MDTWILVAINEEERKRNRWLYILKSRGMPHSNDVRSFDIGEGGVNIQPLRTVRSNGRKTRKSR